MTTHEVKTLTKEQLEQIAATFGLTFVKLPEDTLPVRDGIVDRLTRVWWRGEDGPDLVIAGDEWLNIKGFPNIYTLAEPKIKLEYLD